MRGSGAGTTREGGKGPERWATRAARSAERRGAETPRGTSKRGSTGAGGGANHSSRSLLHLSTAPLSRPRAPRRSASTAAPAGPSLRLAPPTISRLRTPALCAILRTNGGRHLVPCGASRHRPLSPLPVHAPRERCPAPAHLFFPLTFPAPQSPLETLTARRSAPRERSRVAQPSSETGDREPRSRRLYLACHGPLRAAAAAFLSADFSCHLASPIFVVSSPPLSAPFCGFFATSVVPWLPLPAPFCGLFVASSPLASVALSPSLPALLCGSAGALLLPSFYCLLFVA